MKAATAWPWRYLTPIVIVLLLGILAGCLLTFAGAHLGAFMLPVSLAVLMGALMISVVVMRAYRKGFDVFEPINLLAAIQGIAYVARSIYFAAGNYEWMEGFTRVDGPYYLSLALAVALAGVLAFYMGYLSPLGVHVGWRLPAFRDHINIRRLKAMALIYLVIGLLAFALLLVQSGGISLQWTDISRKRAGESEYLRTAAYLLSAAALLRLMAFVKGHRTRFLWLSMALASVVPFVTSSRSNLILWGFAFAVVIHYTRRRFTVRDLLIVLPVFLSIYSVMAGLRLISKRSDIALGDVVGVAATLDKLLGGRDLGDINTLAHIVRVVQQQVVDLQWGQTFIVFLTRPIPRAIWPNKPVNLGGFVAEVIYHRSGGGIPPSFMGELFLNFHVPGVILGMLLFGVVCRAAYEYLRRDPGNPYVVASYGLFVFVTLKLLISDIAIAMTHVMTLVAFFAIPFLYVSRGRRVSRSAGASDRP